MRKKNKGPISASDLMKELENDQAYQAMMVEKERVRKEACLKIAEDEKDLVLEIKSCGYEVESVWDLVNNSTHPFVETNFSGEYKNAYPVLIRHLQISHESAIREGVIRALKVKDGGKDVENALLNEFSKEKESNLKWVLAYALISAMPYHRRKKIPEIAEAYKNGGNA